MTANQWEQIGTHFDRISSLKGKDRTDALHAVKTDLPDIYKELLELLQEDDSPPHELTEPNVRTNDASIHALQ